MVAHRPEGDPGRAETPPLSDPLLRAAALAWSLGIALCASVAASQVLLGLAACAALAAAARGRLRLARPPGTALLALFAGWTVLSALLSGSPLPALRESKEVLLLGVPALGATLLGGARGAERTGAAALAAGALLALWGIGEYLRGLPNPYERIRGPLSHHLTFAGIVMLLLVAAAAWSRSASPALRRAALVSLGPLALALLLNQSRSAWLGAAAGLGVVAARGPRRAALALLVAAAAAIALHPGLRERAWSLVAPAGDTSIEARLAMRATGARIVRERPWLGTGPGGVSAAYARAQDGSYPLPLVQHLHSNSLQISAERGLPAWGAWGAAWVVVALALARPPAGTAGAGRPEIATAALAALLAFLVMGAFEYNFGDAEPSTLLLGLLALPFARGNR